MSDAGRNPVRIARRDDRRWFQRHPDRFVRVRPFRPGEMPIPRALEDQPGYLAVIVHLDGDGLRTLKVVRLAIVPENDDFAAADRIAAGVQA